MMELKSLSELTGRDSVPLFTYGTLMKGQTLEGWLADVAVDREHATVDGYRLYRPEHGWFPYMVASQQHTTQGEIVWVKPGMELSRLVDMEVGAGYSLTLVTALSDTCALPIPVLSFTWHRGLGPDWKPVPNNDWTIAT